MTGSSVAIAVLPDVGQRRQPAVEVEATQSQSVRHVGVPELACVGLDVGWAYDWPRDERAGLLGHHAGHSCASSLSAATRRSSAMPITTSRARSIFGSPLLMPSAAETKLLKAEAWARSTRRTRP